MVHSLESEFSRDRNYSRRYDEVLRRILGESYQDELIGVLRRRGFIDNGSVPQLFLPPDRHELSKARYLFDFYHGDDRILVPVMGPWRRTSKHLHKEPIIERYETLRGEFYLNDALIPSEGLTILPGITHQGETRSEYAITLIVMENARLVPEDQQHCTR